jgi:hypothetical protein
MAAPVASGISPSTTADTQPSRTSFPVGASSPSARASPVTATTAAARAAARTSQRSCWRSTPTARRNRSSSDAADTGSPKAVTAQARLLTGRSRPANPGMASGLGTDR